MKHAKTLGKWPKNLQAGFNDTRFRSGVKEPHKNWFNFVSKNRVSVTPAHT